LAEIGSPADKSNRLSPRMPSKQRNDTGSPALIRKVTSAWRLHMIRKLASGKYRLYSRKVNPKTGKRRNLGTFDSRAAAERHERAVQYFKRH
jgi:hypothetical protein